MEYVFIHFLGTTAVTLFVLLGTPAGYTSARLYKTFGGERWKTNVLLTAFLVSGFIFGMFFVMNLILWGEGSSAAVPFTTILGPCSRLHSEFEHSVGNYRVIIGEQIDFLTHSKLLCSCGSVSQLHFVSLVHITVTKNVLLSTQVNI